MTHIQEGDKSENDKLSPLRVYPYTSINFLQSTKKSGGVGLFDDSSDESSGEEQDGNMFKLRPEFEGSSGKKVN